MGLQETRERQNAPMNLLQKSCNTSGKINTLVTEATFGGCGIWFKDTDIVRFIQKNNYPLCTDFKHCFYRSLIASNLTITL